MSVIMTLRAHGDPEKLERIAAENEELFQSLLEHAKEHGLIAHRFYGSDDGQIMVLDEWPDAESFLSFFEHTRSAIDPMMRDAGVTAEPELTFWRKLATNDDAGWGP